MTQLPIGYPIPPAEFRELVAGEPISIESHVGIGKHICDLVRDKCGVTSSSTVLDIGCGCGRIATPMTECLTEGQYYGFDVVKPMIEWCEANITSRHPNFHFIHADLSNTLYSRAGESASHYRFPFDDGIFDVVFATSVFTHLLPESAAQYAREIARVLKPDTGRALLTFYITNDLFRSRLSQLRMTFPYKRGVYSLMDPNNPERVIAFEEDFARPLLIDAGLTIEHLALGRWSGNDDWTYQDAFLCSRRPNGRG